MSNNNFLEILGFLPKENASGIFYKKYDNFDDYTIEIDFDKKYINYGNLIQTESKTTSNFSQAENFVVLECVNRLLEKGYQPQNIILEKTWATGHGTSGRLDILVTKDDGSAYLMIECKTWGVEFDKELSRLKKDGGQLFTYFQQDKNADVLALYTSILEKDRIIYRNEIVKIEEDYRLTGNVKDFFDRWNKLPKTNGIFETGINAYECKSRAITKLKDLNPEDSSFIFNRFLEILRHNVVSDKPNAFNKIFTLFLCKIYDEKITKPGDEFGFQWFYNSYAYEGRNYPPDDNISFQKRLTDLYSKGMKEFLEKEVTDLSDPEFERKYGGLDENTKKQILFEFTRLRLKKNNEFAIKEVFDDESFDDNAKVVKEVVELLQEFKIRYTQKQQYLSDFFELLLTTGLKQESGQFFTPVPIAQFIIKSTPLDIIVKDKMNKGEKDNLLPFIIDYAAGSGHFIIESMNEIQKMINELNPDGFIHDTAKKIKSWQTDHFDWAFHYIYGIEKDYRLVKVGKVGCYLHGDGLAKVIHSDGLGNFRNTPEYRDKLKITDKDFPKENKQFDIVISNPPYSVSAFKQNARKYYTENDYELYDRLSDQSSEIECLFIERTKQLLKDGGFAGVILPSSILSNSGIYTATREMILKYFEIIAITELGSNTFMATGTNTVVLFLRRRNNYDSTNIKISTDRFFTNLKDVTINGIENPVSKYVSYVWEGLTFGDYLTLLQKNPNQAVENHDIYKEYVKKINGKNEDDKWDKIIELEKEKLFYYVIAYRQKVVLVKSGDKDEEKKFLGYEFSNRRGSEGIHPIQRGKTIDECTKLYDADSFSNPEKASTYIHKAFTGDFNSEIDESLKNNITRINLIDALTFDRADFEKTISLNVKKKVKIESKWETKRFDEIADIIRGVTYSKEDQTSDETNNIILTADNITLDGKFELKKKVFLNEDFNIIDDKKLRTNDIFICFSSGSKEHLGKVAFIDYDTSYYAGGFMGIIRVKNDNKPKYFFQLFNTLLRQTIRDIGSGSNINNLSGIINEMKIPLPPKDIQEKIVAEIEAFEKKEKEINENVINLKKKIFNLFENIINQGKISDLCEIITQKINPTEFPDKKFYYLGLEHIESNTGKILQKNLEVGKNVLSSKNVFYKGTILYGKLRPYLNKVALTDFEGICSTDILVLKTEVPLILKYILLSNSFVEQSSALMDGISLPRIKIDSFLNIKIPLPSLVEQKEIGAKIEAIEKNITKLEKDLETIPNEKESILKKYLN